MLSQQCNLLGTHPCMHDQKIIYTQINMHVYGYAIIMVISVNLAVHIYIYEWCILVTLLAMIITAKPHISDSENASHHKPACISALREED